MGTVDTNFLTSLLAVTADNFVPILQDNIFDNHALLKMIEDNSQVTIQNGGKDLRVPIMVDGATAGSFSYYDNMDITPAAGFINAEITKSNYYVPVVISGQELRENRGESQIVELMSARMQQSEESLRQKLNADLYLDGTGNGGKDITGLLAMVPSSTSPGTYLGINGANVAAWTQKYTAGAVANLISVLTTGFYALTDGSDAPDLIVTSAVGMDLYEGANQSAGVGINYVNSKLADAGFANLSFKGVPMVLDQAHPNNAATRPIYHMLNSKYLGFYWNMGGVSEFVKPADQDAKVAQIIVETQLVTNNRRRQGKVEFTS